MASQEAAKQWQQRQRRSLNGLERLFVACNVRVICGVQLPQARNKSDVLTALKHSFATSKAHFGRLTIEKEDTSSDAGQDANSSSDFLAIADDLDQAIRLTEVAVPPLQRQGRTFDALTDDEAAEDRQVSPSTVVLVRSSASQNQPQEVLGVIFNLNHVFVDGSQLAMFLTDFASALKDDSSALAISLAAPASSKTICASFGVDVALKVPEMSHDQPTFLPLEGNPIKLTDLVAAEASTTAKQVRVWIDDATLSRIRSLARELAQPCTVTGLLAAALQRSIAALFLEANPDQPNVSVSVSIVADMRRHAVYEEREPCVPADPNQFQLAVGSITISAVLNREELSPERLLSQAVFATHDIQRRMARGEHIWQAQALATGRFNEGCPSATVEISNIGILSCAAQLSGLQCRFAQRFDAFTGASIIAHSEPGAGLHMCASVSKQLSAERMQSILDAACEDLAKIVRQP